MHRVSFISDSATSVRIFCGFLGAALCLSGTVGMLFGPAGDATQLLTSPTYNSLCLISGVLALMGIAERTRIARRLCVAVSAVHGGVVLLGAAEAASLSATMLAVEIFQLAWSALVTASCLVVWWYAKSTRRAWRQA